MAKKIDIDLNILLELYQGGKSSVELADYFVCSRETIRRRLRKLGIRSKYSGKKHPSWKGGVRIDSNGYVQVHKPNHPRANMDGYVRRSVLHWEVRHGRRFPKDRVPHHINGDKIDDSFDNIVSLLPSEHSSLHAWLRHKGIVLGGD